MKTDYKQLIQVLVAVFIAGAGWTQENQLVLVSSIAIALVWVLNVIAQRLNYHPGKPGLTGFLFAVSLGLAFLFEPTALPALPAWGNDLAAYTPQLLDYLAGVIALTLPYIASATLIYNILLGKVLDKAATSATTWLYKLT